MAEVIDQIRVLMVYPRIPTTYWSFEYALPFINQKGLMPPLGLLTVAALLPENFQVRLIDMNVEDLSLSDLENTDLVFISAMIVQKSSFHEVVALCNEMEVPVVAGGPYPTTSYKEIAGVDYFVLNEGEITIPLFLEDYRQGKAKHIYEDLRKPDIQKSPVPRFDLIRIHDYATMALQNSRGCPFNCEFCDIIEMFGRNPRYKLPEQVCDELNAIAATNYQGPLFIVDDNFIGNKRKVKELLKSLISWQKEHGYPFSLFTEASIDLAGDDELLDLFVQAGFDMVFIGLETPDEEILRQSNKSQNLRMDLVAAVDKIQRKGIEVLAGFILGFDNEEDDIFDRQIKFIQSSSISMAMIGLMLALPNTQLYRRLEAEGRLLSASSGNNTHELDLNFVPTMPKEQLVDGYKQVLQTIYKPKNYFKRTIDFIHKLPRTRSNLPSERNIIRDVIALLRSIAVQGFSSYAFQYWKFLLRVLLRRPSEFPFAVTQAIKGYHFFRITSEIMKIDAFSTLVQKSLREHSEVVAATLEMSPVENGRQVRILSRKKKNVKRKIIRQFRRYNRKVQSYLYGQLNDFENSLESLHRVYRSNQK